MKNCPICGQEVQAYHELRQTEPYTHTNPMDGMYIYGGYSSPKDTICFQNNYLHFAFIDGEGNFFNHRLVKLGVENPQTKSLWDEYCESQNDDDGDELETIEEDEECYSDYDGDDLPF